MSRSGSEIEIYICLVPCFRSVSVWIQTLDLKNANLSESELEICQCQRSEPEICRCFDQSPKSTAVTVCPVLISLAVCDRDLVRSRSEISFGLDQRSRSV